MDTTKIANDIDGLADRQIKAGGMKLTAGSVMAIFAFMSTIVGGLYGGFVLYQKIEAVAGLDENMDEFKKFDVDGNGTIDQSEWDRMALEDRRLRMQDEDAQRDAQRRMTWYALSGMLLYPFAVILADVFGLVEAARILGSMASIYFVSVAGIVSVFFGANALAKGKQNDESRK